MSNTSEKDTQTNESVNSFTLTDNQTGNSWELPGHTGAMGNRLIDIKSLYGQTGILTYDPGFTSTAACKSDITFINGNEGVLLHRGYAIDELAEHSDYMETCYLLLYGELPTPEQKEEFDRDITSHTLLHEQLTKFYQGFMRSAHPMAISFLGKIAAESEFTIQRKSKLGYSVISTALPCQANL